LDKPRSHWVVGDIAQDADEVTIAADYPVKEPLLPSDPRIMSLQPIACLLLESDHGTPHIRGRGFAREHDVSVVRHETVQTNAGGVSLGRTPEVLDEDLYNLGFRK
jgi:hypothetical protein